MIVVEEEKKEPEQVIEQKMVLQMQPPLRRSIPEDLGSENEAIDD